MVDLERCKLCFSCRNLNLRPETFIQTGWRYPTTLRYKSTSEQFADPVSTSSGVGYYVTGEELEIDEPPVSTPQVVSQGTDDRFESHLCSGRHTRALDKKLPAPVLRHVFTDDGNPEWTVPYKHRRLGTLGEIRQRAGQGCTLCRLVIHASELDLMMRRGYDNVESSDSSDSGSCEIRFDFRDATTHDTDERDTIESKVSQASLHSNPLTDAHRQGYYKCSISCGPNINMDVEPVFQLGSAFAWFGGRQTGPIVDYALLRHWLWSCDNLHPVCNAEKQQIPLAMTKLLRVIDVEHNCLAEIDVHVSQFVALSYVWGDAATLKVTKQNVVDLKESSALKSRMSELPNTVRDAMEVVRNLGHRYLWTDSLCILQDDPLEMQPEMRRMDMIYAAAYFTIVAATGTSVAAGLQGSCSERPREQSIVYSYRDGLDLMINTSPVHKVLLTCPWSQRLWTLQEALMSRRLLIFTSAAVHFTCSSLSWSDNLMSVSESQSPPWYQIEENAFHFRSAITDRDKMPISPPESMWQMELWISVVMDASERRLKYDWDIENATAGLMSQLEMLYQTSNICGLPEAMLHEFLFWSPQSSGRLRRRLSEHISASYPSWSWMGWVGEVTWPGGDISAAEEVLLNKPRTFEILKMVSIEGPPIPLNQQIQVTDRSRPNPCRYLRLRTHKLSLRCEYRQDTPEHIQELQTLAWFVIPSDGESRVGVYCTSTIAQDQLPSLPVGSVVLDCIESHSDEHPFDCLFIQLGTTPQRLEYVHDGGQAFYNVLALHCLETLVDGTILAERIGHGRVLRDETQTLWSSAEVILR